MAICMSKPPASDAFLKKMLQDQRIAKDFLEHYLPQNFKELIDLSKGRKSLGEMEQKLNSLLKD